MVELYPSGIWDRKKWQTERDKAGVTKGACSKVSMGDELDKFHKAITKGVGKGAMDAAKRLNEKTSTYVTAVKQKFPAWSKRVETQIADRAHEIQGDFVKIDQAKDLYNKGVAVVDKAWHQAELDIREWMMEREGTKLKSKFVDALVAGFKEVYAQGQRLTYATDKVDKSIWNEARVLWYAMDGGRLPDDAWLAKAEALRSKLRPV